MTITQCVPCEDCRFTPKDLLENSLHALFLIFRASVVGDGRQVTRLNSMDFSHWSLTCNGCETQSWEPAGVFVRHAGEEEALPIDAELKMVTVGDDVAILIATGL